MAKGASGYLSKTLPAHDLVTAIEAIADGNVVISDPPPRSRPAAGLDWPGRTEGLTDREAEVLALITQGQSNSEIAQVMYLSINTVKTYIRSAYRKIGVTGPIPRHAVGHRPRVPTRPPPHRPLARRTVNERRTPPPS